MNRRARRRSARRRPRRRTVQRSPLPLLLRLIIGALGLAVLSGGVVLATHETGARGGRAIGAIALLGVALIAVAWYGGR